MEKKEAEKVIEIILQCDGGCEYCVSSLLKLFINNFPEHENLAKSAFKKTFDIDIEDFLNREHKKVIRRNHG